MSQPRVAVPCVVEPLESRRLLSAGNILISSSGKNNAEVVYEYTQSGSLVRQLNVPDSPGGYNQLHDLAVDASGKIQLVYGGSYLATNSGAAGWSYHTALDWKIFGVTTAGAMATYKNYVYCQAQDTGPANGIVRFDTAHKYRAQLYQIPNGSGGFREPQDVTMGMDGLLYVVTYNSFPANIVVALDPVTMGVVKTVHLPKGSNGSYCVADAGGNLYVFGGGNLHKLAPDGTPIKSVLLAGSDIDISSDGRLLCNQGAKAVILDLDLNVKTFFSVHGAYWGAPFVAWSTYQAAPGPAGISGQVFDDADADGIKDRREGGLAGVTVFADADNDGALGAGEKSAVSDAAGAYTIAGVAPGSYRVRQSVPAGYRQTAPARRSYFAVALNGSDVAGLQFGDTRRARIAGSAFNDSGGDGQLQPGESPLAGWAAFIDANANGLLDPAETSVLTDANGAFSFDVDAGTYLVGVVRKTGWYPTGPNPAARTISVSPAQLSTGNTFAFKHR